MNISVLLLIRYLANYPFSNLETLTWNKIYSPKEWAIVLHKYCIFNLILFISDIAYNLNFFKNNNPNYKTQHNITHIPPFKRPIFLYYLVIITNAIDISSSWDIDAKVSFTFSWSCSFCSPHKVTQYKKGKDSLAAQGKRRYDRKQSGYGGQTKPVFHKKVRRIREFGSTDTQISEWNRQRPRRRSCSG